MDKAFAKEILEKYFNKKDRILKITLTDKSVIEGMLISFFEEQQENGESFIYAWHFLDKDEIEAYNESVAIGDVSDFGKMIKQKHIQKIEFK